MVSGVPSTDPLTHDARASRVAAALVCSKPNTTPTMKGMLSKIVGGGVAKLKKRANQEKSQQNDVHYAALACPAYIECGACKLQGDVRGELCD